MKINTNLIDKTDFIKTTETTSDENTYSCDYINTQLDGKVNESQIKMSKTTSNNDTYSCNYINNQLDLKGNEGTLLWTNSNFGNPFSAQTLTFNNTYKYYDIIIVQDSAILKTCRVFAEDTSVNYLLENNLNGFIRTRTVKAYSNKLVFYDAIFYETYNNYSTNNSQCVPYKIYGYK